MNASKPYYFEFETHPDRTLTGHCVVIETHHFTSGMMQSKLALLGSSSETDPRIEKLFRQGYDNYTKNLANKTPETQIEGIRDMLELACKFLQNFPAAQMAASLSSGSLNEASQMLLVHRKEMAALFAESANNLDSASCVYAKAIKELKMVKQALDLDEIERFVKLANEIDRLSKDGLFDRLRAFNHEVPKVP